MLHRPAPRQPSAGPYRERNRCDERPASHEASHDFRTEQRRVSHPCRCREGLGPGAEDDIAMHHSAPLMSEMGLVSRVTPVQTAMRNCTRDEGRSFEFSNQVLISSHRKLLSSKAMVVNVAEKSEHDSGTFRTRAWLSFAPPTCRMPLGQSQCIPQADPGGRVSPRF